MSDRDIAAYYDRNTSVFLHLGGGKSSGAIHRQLWGPGVDSVTAASNYVNTELARAILGLQLPDRAVVLDLGCGVGGTLFHLAGQLSAIECHGITISASQARAGELAIQDLGLGGRCSIECADFENVTLPIRANVVIAIEAYAHSRSAEAFFSTVAAHLRDGGRLFLIDDFLETADLSNPDVALCRDRFRRGWRVPAFDSLQACRDAAARSGLELADDRDLTGLIRLRRMRDRLIAIVAPALDRLGLAGIPYAGNLIGGAALNRGLRHGWFAYHWLEFRAAG